MFETSGDDIRELSDADLRSLVHRLALAELRKNGQPLSCVTAGGHQDAPDGGIDVRVDCPNPLRDPDFVPRGSTGFQVKKPDMPASAIEDEMRPKGLLRKAIRDLADASGSYIIVSAQGSLTPTALAARREAMREALSDLPNAGQLHTDFYDRNRIATWANQYPGIAAWLRSKVGRPLSGWSGIGDWAGRHGASLKPYLSDDHACLIDERPTHRKHVTIPEGISRLRDALRAPRQCIRLVGLSGVGKTRLVQALFEPDVGASSLDPSLAVCTDYTEETRPSAREMALQLIADRRRAILIVDNCNPATHSAVADLCASEGSEVSLITVEYDVRDDELEHTDVFRLQAGSANLVAEWIKQTFPHVSQLDRERIAEFSDGNSRVAGALARTIGKGETLGSLKSRELFERIFRQRNEPDRQLLEAAEDLSLLYSIDGENVCDGSELAHVAGIRDVGARSLSGALVEMRRRGVAQARGRFRAILPQAIANTLAAHALERIPPRDFDDFCVELPARALKSVSRRLGFLHDSQAAQSTVARWLQADGPLSDLCATHGRGFQIVTNIAPVAPDVVLAKLEEILPPLTPDAQEAHRWVPLIKNIGYEARSFERAVMLLAPFAARQQESNNVNSAHTALSSFFYIQLSGTEATPEQRWSMIRQLAASADGSLRGSAEIAMRALLKSSHFASTGSYEFGARPRGWGWCPKINKEASEWFDEAITLVLQLMPHDKARAVIAEEARGLWRWPGGRAALERAANVFIETRPWIEGWSALRMTLRFDGEHMADDVRARLERFVARLAPSDLLNQARAVVLNRMPGGGGWDFADGEDDEGDAKKAYEKADRMAEEVGRSLANDATMRSDFLAEVFVAPHALRAFECGLGIGKGADDLHAMWVEIASAYGAADSQTRDARLLRGFICGAHGRDEDFTALALEAAIDNRELSTIVPYLQAGAGINTTGIARLRRGIAKGVLHAADFRHIANSSVANSPPEELAALLEDIATLPQGGVEIGLEILHMYWFRHRDETRDHNARLVAVGRELLVRADFSKDSPLGDLGAGTVMRICLAGEAGKPAAEQICANLCSAIDAFHVYPHNVNYTFKALVEAQPFVTLDAFLLSPAEHGIRHRFDLSHAMGPSLERVPPAVLQAWASCDPDVRYPLIGKCLSMFVRKNNEEQNELAPLFLSMLDQAPDKRLFLGDAWERVCPQSWGGSLAHILLQRKTQLARLADDAAAEVRAWVTQATPELDRWIEEHRVFDREREASFE